LLTSLLLVRATVVQYTGMCIAVTIDLHAMPGKPTTARPATRCNLKCADVRACERRQSAVKIKEIAKAEVLALFKKFDSDGNGTISVYELHSLMRKLHPLEFKDQKKCQCVFKVMDVDQNGSVDVSEFVAWVWGSGREIAQQALKAGHALNSTHKDPIAYLFWLVDKNSSGVITETEFLDWVEVAETEQPELKDVLDYWSAISPGRARPASAGKESLLHRNSSLVEEDPDEEDGEYTTLDLNTWTEYLMSFDAKLAASIIDAGTTAGKINLLRRQCPGAPIDMIREALEKKQGSTTSALHWLNHCKEQGEFGSEDESEDDQDEDEDE